MQGRSVEITIALTCLVFGLLAAFVWVPFDSETPAIYEFRRQTYIGDAMLPMVAASGIAICAAFHLLISWRRKVDDSPVLFDGLTTAFFVSLAVIVAVSLLMMMWAGPLSLALLGQGGEEPATYRQMRATIPWKYIGFVVGGFFMVFGVTSLVEGSVRLNRAVIALLAVALLILVFDVPFDTILLPPNGDF